MPCDTICLMSKKVRPPSPTARSVILGGKELTAAQCAAQQAVRRARTQGAQILLAILGGGLALLFLFSVGVSRNASGSAGLTFFLLLAALLFALLYFANNFWQWRLLLDLHCPHCEAPLVDRIHWTRRPGYHCPHCGQEALATARQLGEG